MTDNTTLLQVENLSVAFGHPGERQAVVQGVDFSISPGEKLALVGESGSGKSVTALSILRLHDPSLSDYPTGQIRFLGQSLHQLSDSEMRQVRGRDISMIFQEPMISLNPVYTIGEQLIEPLLLHRGMNRSEARAEVVSLLEKVGIDEADKRFEAFPHMLSGGQRQRAMIAMALACRPKLLIADEPTTALDVTIQKQIIELLEELQRDFGMAVLLITHDLNMVRRFADRVCVMQEGKLVETAAVEQLFESPQHPYTQKLLASEPEPLTDGKGVSESEAMVLRGETLRCYFPVKTGFFRRTTSEIKAVDGVSVTIRSGETIGIVGESGSGKSTLGRCLLRLQSCEGDINFEGEAIHGLTSRQLRPMRRHFQVVFQDPFSSLSPRMTIEQIIGEGLQLHFPQLGPDERRQRIISVLDEVGLEAGMLHRYPHEFSGGQRQRIAIARAIVLEPKLILLDEPTSALDVTVQKQVLGILADLQKRHGISYLFISHDLKVIRAVSHRVLVMHQGRIVEQGDTREIFEHPQHPYTQLLLEAALFREAV